MPKATKRVSRAITNGNRTTKLYPLKTTAAARELMQLATTCNELWEATHAIPFETRRGVEFSPPDKLATREAWQAASRRLEARAQAIGEKIVNKPRLRDLPTLALAVRECPRMRNELVAVVMRLAGLQCPYI